MTETPFNQRFGLANHKVIDHDFPISSRVALTYLLIGFVKDKFIESYEAISSEILRTGRLPLEENRLDYSANSPTLFDQILNLLGKLNWFQVYMFCERIYDRVLRPLYESDFNGNSECVVPIEVVRSLYADEINTILAEDNLAYFFSDGRFQRRGRAQTQKNLNRVGSVLGDPDFLVVRQHFNKAKECFNKFPDPDLENCVKEAMCSLEACLEILLNKSTSKDFEKLIKQKTGNEPGHIPPPIAEAMIKLHAYRGSGQGVSHAALHGNRVNLCDAELTLSVVAAFITYLVDTLRDSGDDIPF